MTRTLLITSTTCASSRTRTDAHVTVSMNLYLYVHSASFCVAMNATVICYQMQHQPTSMWKHRPSALTSNKKYANLTVEELYEHYMLDNEAATVAGVTVPSRPSTSNNKKDGNNKTPLRTCQWNVHYFEPTKEFPNASLLAMEIADRLVETEADVIVLNEFGIQAPAGVSHVDTEFDGDDYKKDPTDYCRERLELYGYSLYTSQCLFPTAVATKVIPVAAGPSAIRNVALDHSRAAVAVPIDLHLLEKEKGCHDDKVDTKPQFFLWIYGTHLEAGDDHTGRYRREEINRLLQFIQQQHQKDITHHSQPPSRVMVIGDFNQQRSQDYTTREWEKICQSKKRRDYSPVDDGVATKLHEAGFQCIFDSAILDKHVQRNWPVEMPPPSSHWSGTLIDYTYFLGPGITLTGVYVSGCGLSDHRMIVCDCLIVNSDQ